jgi:hypothetical protein
MSRPRGPPGIPDVWTFANGGEENMTEAVKLRLEEEETLRALLRRADALNTACLLVRHGEVR